MNKAFETPKGKVSVHVDVSWPRSMDGLGLNFKFRYCLQGERGYETIDHEHPSEDRNPQNTKRLLDQHVAEILAQYQAPMDDDGNPVSLFAADGWKD